MKLDNTFFEELLGKAALNERKRLNYDLRNGSEDGSQRMLNALLPETVVPIHRHHASNETVALLKGSVTEVFYEEFQDSGSKFQVKESARYELYPGDVLQIPKDAWHTIIANEPSVILEAKDGAFHPLAEDEVFN